MNEAACTGEHTTVLSVLQMEHHGNLVADEAAEEKERQKIITPEGHVFPLSIINGLAHLKMRRHTNAEFDSPPHIVPTSDEMWNPRQCDEETSADDIDFTLSNPANCHLLPCDDHNTKGECIENLTEHRGSVECFGQHHLCDCNDAQCFHDQSTARCMHSAFKAATSNLWAHAATRRGAKKNLLTDDEPANDAP